MLLVCNIRVSNGLVNTVRLALLVAAAILSTTGSVANATPIVLVDTFDPGRLLFAKKGGDCVAANGIVSGSIDGRCRSISYTHALDSTSTSASLAFLLEDDAGTRPDRIDVYLNGSKFLNNVDIVTAATTQFDVTPFLTNTDVLSVMVKRGNEGAKHDFWFVGSNLRSEGADVSVPAPVAIATPEPASMMLLGAGLLIIGRRLTARRSKR